MHQKRTSLGKLTALHQTSLGKLTVLPQTSQLDISSMGRDNGRGRGKDGRGEGGRERTEGWEGEEGGQAREEKGRGIAPQPFIKVGAYGADVEC